MRYKDQLINLPRQISNMLMCALTLLTLNHSSSRATVGLQPPASDQPQYGVSMGTVTVLDEQLYRISLRPDIPLGKLGVAFDIELFIDENGNFSDRGWEFDGSTEVLDTFLRKIYYIRYGRPKDDLYVRIGALNDITLGYGLIVDRYRNTLHYPGVKKTGLEFRARNIGRGLSIEGMVNNLQDLASGGALAGLRISGKAVGKIDIGLTYVVDLDQYGGLFDRDGDGFPDDVDAFPEDSGRSLDNDRDGVADQEDSDDDNDGRIDIDAPGSGLPGGVIAALEAIEEGHGDSIFALDRSVSRKSPFNKNLVGRDMFSILGLDAGYPLAESESIRLILYGQLALMIDDDDELPAAEDDAQGVVRGNRKTEGFGIMAPGLWLELGPFEGRAEYRYFQDNFDVGYFDNLYELDRARIDVATGKAMPKDAGLRRGESIQGVLVGLGTDLYDFLEVSADYQYFVGSHPSISAYASLSRKLLDTVPRLTVAEAYYQKSNIGSELDAKGTPGSEDDFFESTMATFYGHRVGFEMANGVSLVWDTRYLFAREASGKLDRHKVMSAETVFSF